MRALSACTLCLLATLLGSAHVFAVDLTKIDRTITREPQYESQPKYCLLVFGPDAKTRVWLVEDGKRLFVDRNANGDLTDDGEPTPSSDDREFQSTDPKTNQPITMNDWDYEVGDISTAEGDTHTKLHVMRWKYGNAAVNHGVLVNVGGKVPTYAGWNKVFADKPADAPIMHFGGEYVVTPLRNKELVLNKPPSRFSIAFSLPGKGTGSTTRISIDALAPSVVPICQIEWPAKDPKGPPIRTTLELNERCCYWEFYNTHVTIPEGAGEGTAHVTVMIPDKLPFKLVKHTFDMPVVQGTPPTPEPTAAALPKAASVDLRRDP